MLNAVSGRPPIAYTSLNALTAAMAPNVNGSSTIGVKKSTVCTRAHSGESLYTPASSDVSNPTRMFGSSRRGKRGKTWSKTFGLSLDAQPAALTCAVNFLVWGMNYFKCSERSFLVMDENPTGGLSSHFAARGHGYSL